MLNQDLEVKAVEVAVAVSWADDGPNRSIHPFRKAIGDALSEVARDLLPPVLQGVHGLDQVALSRPQGLPNPGLQEPSRLFSLAGWNALGLI